MWSLGKLTKKSSGAPLWNFEKKLEGTALRNKSFMSRATLQPKLRNITKTFLYRDFSVVMKNKLISWKRILFFFFFFPLWSKCWKGQTNSTKFFLCEIVFTSGWQPATATCYKDKIVSFLVSVYKYFLWIGSCYCWFCFAQWVELCPKSFSNVNASDLSLQK